MDLYTYLGQGTLKHDGVRYTFGDVLELTEEQAAQLGDAVRVVGAPDADSVSEDAPAPAPRHRRAKAKE